jgi:hypothetical protein
MNISTTVELTLQDADGALSITNVSVTSPSGAVDSVYIRAGG